MGKLDGKVALISGGARGQGAAEAKTFSKEGASVVFGDVRDAEGKQVEDDIRVAGGEASAGIEFPLVRYMRSLVLRFDEALPIGQFL